jgi:trimethylamine--corrinoid protein Co-methyltransferase
MIDVDWFDKKDIYSIHKKSLELIEEVGFKLDDADLLKKLKGFDTKIDLSNRSIRISKKVSEDFLTKIPKKIKLYGIDSKYDIELGKQKYYRPISGTINIIKDYVNVRKPTKKDVKNVAKVVQNLDFIHFNATAVHPFNVPNDVMDIAAAKISFENCSKHILVDTLNKNSFEAVLEMAFKIAGSEKQFRLRPFFQVHFPAVSPLIFDKNACSNLKLATEYRIPIRIGSSPMSGGNSPIKLAGTLLLMHTEIIAGAIIAQMLNEGCPVYCGAAPTIFDMKFGTMSWGSAEHAKMAACSARLAHYCNMFASTTGFATDSKMPDQQSVIEKSMNVLLAALSGVDILAGAGLFEGELTYDIVQLVIDNEIAKYVENILRGIEINEENMSNDLIKEIGIGGNYLATEQTLNLFKTERESSELFDRRSRGTWNNIEEKSMYEKAKKIADDIISNKNEYVLPDKVIGEIEEVYLKYSKN